MRFFDNMIGWSDDSCFATLRRCLLSLTNVHITSRRIVWQNEEVLRTISGRTAVDQLPFYHVNLQRVFLNGWWLSQISENIQVGMHRCIAIRRSPTQNKGSGIELHRLVKLSSTIT